MKQQVKGMMLNYYQIEHFTRLTVSLLRKNNIDCYLLKGLSLADCYPVPEYRKLGDLDLYLAFALAGHHNLIQYWLEVRPDLEARTVAAALNRMFYAPLFVDDTSRHWHPRIPDFERPVA